MLNAKTDYISVVYLLLLLLLGCGLQGSVSATETPRPTISDIRAKLFYESTGEFSPNVLNNTGFILWNVIIGEGSAKGESNETLGIIEISSKPGTVYTEYALNFKATYKFGEVDSKGNPRLRDITVEDTRQLGTFSSSAKGKKYFGFWLYDTGCIPVRIRASISPINLVKEVELPFKCGE